MQGVDNSYGAFQLPLTLDFFPRAIFSPYFGAGLATNTDTSNTTDAMLTGGFDLNLVRHLTLGFNVNYVFQSALNDTDWEAMALLYFRF
jgi:outer membrane protein W